MKPADALFCSALVAAAACSPPSSTTSATATEETTSTTADASSGGTAQPTTTGDPTSGGPWELGACNPVDPALCILPYPSLFHGREADTPTGYRVAFTSQALPVNTNMVGIDPRYLNEKDEFGTLGALLFQFDDVDLAGTIGHADIGDHALPDARTVLLDTETGERVPHWVELDATTEDPRARLVIVHPAVPLRHGRRHVFGVRGLQTQAGEPVAVSPAFAALRDRAPTGDGGVEGQRAHYEADIFPALAAAGFPRDELQLAWDFVTVSRETSLGRMQWLRDDVLAALGPDGPAYTIESVEEQDCANPDTQIGRALRIEMTVPLYTETDAPGTLLTRDAAGMPFRNGEKVVDVMLRIPCSLIDQPTPRSAAWCNTATACSTSRRSRRATPAPRGGAAAAARLPRDRGRQPVLRRQVRGAARTDMPLRACLKGPVPQGSAAHRTGAAAASRGRS